MSGRALAVLCSLAGQFARSGSEPQPPVFASTTSLASIQSSPASSATGARRALLIGVTEFINGRMKKRNLDGSANDLHSSIEVPREPRFDVPRANVGTLAGLPSNRADQPTNIERAFADLVAAAHADDQISIL